MVDPNKLYNLALGIYDLDLALMVAEFTQKDPKEYLSYIEELKSITDPIEFRSRINIDLKNFDEAIKILAEGTEE